jgi:hypothetical protein
VLPPLDATEKVAQLLEEEIVAVKAVGYMEYLRTWCDHALAGRDFAYHPIPPP